MAHAGQLDWWVKERRPRLEWWGPPNKSWSCVIKGLTWNEVADQVDMTVSGAWSRYRKARPPKSPRLGRWQQALVDALDQTLPLAAGRPSPIISAEPPPGLNSLLPDEPPTVLSP